MDETCASSGLNVNNFIPYVLHAFQKKSKIGRETPRRHMDLIQQRLRQAEQMAKEMKS
jgi:phage-related protein